MNKSTSSFCDCYGAPMTGNEVTVRATMAATVVEVQVTEGELVPGGASVVILESMKMEHLEFAPASGRVQRVLVAAGQAVAAGDALVILAEEHAEHAVAGSGSDASGPDLDATWLRLWPAMR